MTKTFQIVYEADPAGGYVVTVPVLPGCVTQGETFEEAQKNAREAVELYLSTLNEEGEDIPESGDTVVGNLEVDLAHA